MLILLPLIKDAASFLRLTDGIQHIAVALAVNRLLKGLDGKAQVYFISRNVLADVRQISGLDTVQKDQKGEYLIISSLFCLGKKTIVLHIHSQIDFLRNPEIIHGLTVPVADPFIFHIVKIV